MPESLTIARGLQYAHFVREDVRIGSWYSSLGKAMAKKMPILSLLHSDERVLSILNQTNEVLETHKSDIADRISDSVWILRSLYDLLPETTESIWSGHVFPLSEAQYELESSIVFCKFGFYKHAIGCLRNVLELGLLLRLLGHRRAEPYRHTNLVAIFGIYSFSEESIRQIKEESKHRDL
jgi:hypothetical protein